MHRVAAIIAAGVSLALLGANTTSLLDSYREALATRKLPSYMEFTYTVTRSGPGRIITEQHRVYWTSSGEERNDTIEVNGTVVIPAPSRVLHRTAWPYNPGQFVVSGDEYDATPAGTTTIAGHKVYAFALTRISEADFMMKSLYIDVHRRLPVRQTFAVAGADCAGSGTIDFGPVGAYWLPAFVSVICTQSSSSASPPPVYKESIRFNGYQFPNSIPADVFGAAGGASSSSSTLGTP